MSKQLESKLWGWWSKYIGSARIYLIKVDLLAWACFDIYLSLHNAKFGKL